MCTDPGGLRQETHGRKAAGLRAGEAGPGEAANHKATRGQDHETEQETCLLTRDSGINLANSKPQAPEPPRAQTDTQPNVLFQPSPSSSSSSSLVPEIDAALFRCHAPETTDFGLNNFHLLQLLMPPSF